MTYLNQLNPAQQEAVLHTEGPLLIFAGAGSGKTRVLTYRIAHLIESGVDPYHIIAITFTNKAAREMRERVSNIAPLGEQVWVSTFHAACSRILRREIEHIGYQKNFTIYDTQDTVRLLKECIADCNLNSTNYPHAAVANRISGLKNELVSAAEFEQTSAGSFRDSNIADVYVMYQDRLKRANALDFDDIIMKTVELFKGNEEILLKYQRRFRYVLVDEYQDTNHAQYVLVRLFSGYANNLCVVGDDDQSIYGWRGANIRNILDFEEDYPGAKVVKLEQNYRSTGIILDSANVVIHENENRAQKMLWTENPRGQTVKRYHASDDKDEATFVARIIGAQQNRGEGLRDVAVLYRTNAQSRAVEDALVAANLPYRVFSGVRFYERMEIKDVLAYLKVINNPADDVSFMRIINVPKRNIGTTTINKIQMYAKGNGLTFYGALKQVHLVPDLGKKAAVVEKFLTYIHECADFSAGHSVGSLISKILRETGYIDSLDDGTPEGDDRVENVQEFLAKAHSFERDSEDVSLDRFLDEVALVAEIDNYDESADAVSLMTLHSAKGLEFGTVFIVGMEEYIFPSSRAIDSEKQEDMEEESRLCYVGITRAKHLLYLTHAASRRRFDRTVKNPRSRFMHLLQDDWVSMVDMQGDEYSTQYRRGFDRVRNDRLPMGVSGASNQTGALEPKTLGDLIKLPNNKKPPELPTPKRGLPEYSVGDKVKQQRYGVGEVVAIKPGGVDYEITVSFPGFGNRKFMSSLARLEIVETGS